MPPPRSLAALALPVAVSALAGIPVLEDLDGVDRSALLPVP